MTRCTAPGCARPTRDSAAICDHCCNDLEVALAELPAWLQDLAVTEARQDRLGDAAKATASGPAVDRSQPRKALPPHLRSRHADYALPETPWPYSPDADEVLTVAENTLTTWARAIAEARGVCVTGTGPDLRQDVRIRSAVAAARWLHVHLRSIRLDEAAGEIVDEVTSLRDQIRAQVDARDMGEFITRCKLPLARIEVGYGEDEVTVEDVQRDICGGNLMGFAGQAKVICPRCRAKYDRDTLVADGIDNVRGDATEMAARLSEAGDRVTPERIRHLHKHGHLRARVGLVRGVPVVFALKDAFDLLESFKRQEQADDARFIGMRGTPAEVSKWLGGKVTVECIEQWRRRKRITADGNGMVLVEDVNKLAASAKDRQTAKLKRGKARAS